MEQTNNPQTSKWKKLPASLLASLSKALSLYANIMVSIVTSFIVPTILYGTMFAFDLPPFTLFENILISVSTFFICQFVNIHNQNIDLKEKLQTIINNTNNCAKNGDIQDINNGIGNINRKVDNLIAIGDSKECEKIGNSLLALVGKEFAKLGDKKRADPLWDFFINWYKREFETLNKNIVNTLKMQYVKLMAYELLNDKHPINQAFNSQTHILRAVCACSDIKWWLEPDGKDYTNFVQKKVNGGEVHNVQRIFIYDKDEDLEDILVKLCFKLHKNHVYDFRIINKERYESAFKTAISGKSDEHDTRQFKKDFEIYGTKFVWEKNDGYMDSKVVVGDFTMKLDRVRVYESIFDQLWNKIAFAEDIGDNTYTYPNYTLEDLSKIHMELQKEEGQKSKKSGYTDFNHTTLGH